VYTYIVGRLHVMLALGRHVCLLHELISAVLGRILIVVQM